MILTCRMLIPNLSNPSKQWWHNSRELPGGTSAMDIGWQSSLCQDGLVSPTPQSAPSPEVWESQTMMKSKKQWEKHIFFFIAFHQDRGRQVQGPQGRSLPRPPPWDWVEAVKRRGSQAAPVTVTLRVRSQHCDCLIHTYFLILTVPLSWTWAWYVPCRVHTGWETKETWAYALLYVRGNFPICGQSL